MINIKTDSTVNLYEKLEAITAELKSRAVVDEAFDDSGETVTETIEHEGLLLRKVDRKCKTGDWVRFSGLPRHIKLTANDKFYEVVDGSFYKNDIGARQHVNGWSDGRFPEVFEEIPQEGQNITQDMPIAAHSSGEKPKVKSPNQHRHETIQRAKKFVEEHQKDIPGFDGLRNYGNVFCRSHFYETEFHVKGNRVTAVIYRVNPSRNRLNKKTLVGRAICSVGDVFNEWIGKAISLCKALEIDIPQEFLDAIQPDEVVVGMDVKPKGDSCFTGEPYRVQRIEGERAIDLPGCGWAYREALIIIDDSNAEYVTIS